MANPLQGCHIFWPGRSGKPIFPEIYESLEYQFTKLGGEVALDGELADNVFEFFLGDFYSQKKENNNRVLCFFVSPNDFLEAKSNPNDFSPEKLSERIIYSEFLAQANSGIMSIHGRSYGGIEPLGIKYLSIACASTCITTVVSAALERINNKKSINTLISLDAVGLLCTAQYIAGATAQDFAEKILPEGLPTRSPFTSKDNVIFEIETLAPQPWKLFWENIFSILAENDHKQSVNCSAKELGNSWASFMQRYAKATLSLNENLFIALKQLDFHDINAIANQNFVSLVRVRSFSESLNDEDTKSLLSLGPWSFSCSVVKKSEKSTIKTNDNLRDFSSKDDQLPLSQYRVVESCRRIQGPLAGALLQRLGANIIRIEPPGGDPLRDMPPLSDDVSSRFSALNEHKIVKEIDIKSSEGKSQIYKLVENSDVFIHNWSPGKAQDLSLSSNELHAVNHNLIYSYAGGFSKNSSLAIIDKIPGTDFTVQAYSGVAHHIGDSSGKAGGTLFTALDVLGGILAAQGVVLGLFRKSVDEMQLSYYIESTLLGAASLLLGGTVNDCQDLKKSSGKNRQNLFISDERIKSIFTTKLGKIAVDVCGYEKIIALINALGISSDFNFPFIDDDFSKIFHTQFLKNSADDWKSIFDEFNIDSMVVLEDLSTVVVKEFYRPFVENSSYAKIISPWIFVAS